HIVGTGFLQQFVADHIGIVPQMGGQHDGHGQNQMEGPVRDIIRPADTVGAAAGQPAEGNAEYQDQYQGKPELGDTTRQRPQSAEQAVGPSVLKPCAQKPQAKRSQKNHDEPEAAQNKGVADAQADDFQY